MTAQNQTSILNNLLHTLIRGTIPFFIGASLMAGGIILLTLPIPGWKLIFGLPAVQLGIVFLILAFDDITKRRLHPDNYSILICPECGYQNIIHNKAVQKYCSNCRKLMKPKIKGETNSS